MSATLSIPQFQALQKAVRDFSFALNSAIVSPQSIAGSAPITAVVQAAYDQFKTTAAANGLTNS